MPEAGLTNTMMTVSHIVRGLARNLQAGGGGCALPLKKIKQVVKSGTASQQSAGEGCLQTASSPRPDQPQPRPSDVCVPSLMKKFWYLGETLLSAE